jgi:hypothetical protein
VIIVCDKFSEIVKRGSRVALKQVHQGEILKIRGDSSAHYSGDFTIYASECAGARWVTDAGMSRIGSVRWMGNGGDRVRVDLCFGTTEIRATVVNVTTGAVTPANVAYDFRDVARDCTTATAAAAAASTAALRGSGSGGGGGGCSGDDSALLECAAGGGASASRGEGGVSCRPRLTGAVTVWRLHTPVAGKVG